MDGLDEEIAAIRVFNLPENRYYARLDYLST